MLNYILKKYRQVILSHLNSISLCPFVNIFSPFDAIISFYLQKLCGQPKAKTFSDIFIEILSKKNSFQNFLYERYTKKYEFILSFDYLKSSFFWNYCR